MSRPRPEHDLIALCLAAGAMLVGGCITGKARAPDGGAAHGDASARSDGPQFPRVDGSAGRGDSAVSSPDDGRARIDAAPSDGARPPDARAPDAQPPDARIPGPCETLTVKEKITCKDLGAVTITGRTTYAGGCYRFDTLTVTSTAVLTLLTRYTARLPTTLAANVIKIAKGGVIAANGQGYTGMTGPGAGKQYIYSKYRYRNGSGAGHGGVGGLWGYAAGGGAYGSSTYPILAGSGGGNGLVSGRSYPGGRGGGAIRLCAERSITLDGSVQAVGLGSTRYGGGGSGGSVLVITPAFDGSGNVNVVGGTTGSTTACTNIAGGGAGGRIAIRATRNLFKGTATRTGGGSSCLSGRYKGKTGSVYNGGLP